VDSETLDRAEPRDAEEESLDDQEPEDSDLEGCPLNHGAALFEGREDGERQEVQNYDRVNHTLQICVIKETVERALP
jgi:hypothetical protein